MAAASGVFRDVFPEEPPYHTAEDLWEGLKHGDEGARLLFVFFLRLGKNERTHSRVENTIPPEGKKSVGFLIEEAWRLYLLMAHRTVPYQAKPKSVVAIEGSRAQRHILATSGLAGYTAPSVKERAAVKLQITWNNIHQQWVVMLIDNCYNKKFTTNPDIQDFLQPDGKQVEIELSKVRIDQQKTRGQIRKKDRRLLLKRIEPLEATPPTRPIHTVLREDNSMFPTDSSGGRRRGGFTFLSV